jgi:hypothetical protein
MKIKIMVYGLLMAQSTVFCANPFYGAPVNYSGADQSIAQAQAQELDQLEAAQRELVRKYQKEKTTYLFGIPFRWPTEEQALQEICGENDKKIASKNMITKIKNLYKDSRGLFDIVTVSRDQSALPSIEGKRDATIYYDSQFCNDDTPGAFLENPIDKMNDSGTNGLADSTNFVDASVVPTPNAIPRVESSINFGSYDDHPMIADAGKITTASSSPLKKPVPDSIDVKRKKIYRPPVSLPVDFVVPDHSKITMNKEGVEEYELWLAERKKKLQTEKEIEDMKKESREEYITALNKSDKKLKEKQSNSFPITESIDQQIEKEKEALLLDEELLLLQKK